MSTPNIQSRRRKNEPSKTAAKPVEKKLSANMTSLEFKAEFEAATGEDEKLAVAKAWTTAYPTDTTGWFMLGEVEREYGHDESALDDFRTAWNLDKNNLAINGRMGDMLFAVERYGESLEHFTYIIEQPNPPAWAYIGAANCAERLEDSGSALGWLLEAYALQTQRDQVLSQRIVENFWRLPKEEKPTLIESVKAHIAVIVEGFSSLLLRILDAEYADLNSDVDGSGLTAAQHFALYGIPEQRPISRLFDKDHLSAIAREQALDLCTQHYSAVFFVSRNRTWLPNPWLQLGYLRKHNPNLKRATPHELLVALLDCQLEHIHPLFDVGFYKAHAQQQGLTVEGPAFLHYLQTGWKFGADPHPLFDGSYYVVDLRGGLRLDPNDSPLTEFIRSRNESAYSPSPFIDLKYLQHLMVHDGYDFVCDAAMLADILDREWVNIHKQIHRSMLSLLLADEELAALSEPEATLRQFADLVGQIRLGRIAPRTGLDISAIDANRAMPAKVSVVILNYNKPIYTLLSIYSACRAGQSVPLEVLVVDNASEPFHIELLYRYTRRLPNVRILAIKQNRFFGEGNNIAIDQARGDYIFLLNNDAILGPNTLDQLLANAEADTTLGAIAPVLVLPDGRLQEVGGTIFGSGQVVQRSKHITLDDFIRIEAESPTIQDTDYASAACLLLKKSTLDKVLGFDVTFDPFYYEDTDLCARIRAQGLRIAVQVDAFAMHVENASTREFLGDNWMELVGRQRQKFANRWHGVYEHLNVPDVAAQSERHDAASKYEILTPRHAKLGYSGKPIAWVHTPFDIRVGGGERYILSVASALEEHYETWFLTQQRMSRARLALTMDDLAIRPGRFHAATLDDSANWPRPELYVVMGNEIEPPTPGYGQRNIYHIQFPFPIHHTGHFSIERIHGFDAFMVNSQFTADNVRKALATYKIGDKPIHIVHPPVAIPTLEEQQAILAQKQVYKDIIKIVNIGRFVTRGHHKRQDVVMDIAEECHRLKLPVRFELYGGLGEDKDDVAYFANLAERGVRIKAKVQANVSRRVIENALNEATYYLHPCGMGHYPGLAPEKLEHFGITVVEAMSRGVVPIVYGWGGGGGGSWGCELG